MKLELTKIEAITLEEAYTKASTQLGCSITDLEFEIIQNPSKGFLGFGKKMAIVVAARKLTASTEKYNQPTKEKKEKQPYKSDEKKYQHKPSHDTMPARDNAAVEVVAKELAQENIEAPVKKSNAHFDKKFSGIEDGFFVEKMEIEDICLEVKHEINKLFEISCFDLNEIEVTPEDEATILIKITGEDSALMIGKEGYRYNAMSYLLFNWINPRYKVGIKLEIAEFLQNQEEIVRKYVDTVVTQVRNSGQARTKPLDGILLQIAIKELRSIFPEKYVGVKTSENGSKFIVINEFSKKSNA